MQAIPDMDNLVLCLWCGGYDSRLAHVPKEYNHYAFVPIEGPSLCVYVVFLTAC